MAAAGVSLLACQSAEADTIAVFNPNVNVGFAAGDLDSFKLSIGSLTPGFRLATNVFNSKHSVRFQGTAGFANTRVDFKVTNSILAPAIYGRKFSQIGTGISQLFVTLLAATSGNVIGGADFSREYYAFSFLDASTLPHYGWTYGTLTGAYSDMSYDLISWAYDQTPNEEIGMGFTGSSTPEPSTLVLGAMAALILGAAGVRRWNRARA